MQLVYPSTSGSPKQCIAIPLLQVRCAAGEQEIDRACRPIVRGLCEQASASFAAVETTLAGARSIVTANLTLPTGSIATITAVPLRSTVTIPVTQPRIGEWAGSATVPTTGAWSVRISIGKEQCTSLGTSLDVGCMETFLDDGQGRCVCPIGEENVGGRCVRVQPAAVDDPCMRVTVSATSSGSAALTIGAPVRLTPGSAVAVAIAGGTTGYKTLLVPEQGTETRNVAERIALSTLGNFSLHLLFPSATGGPPRQCALLPTVVVECNEGEYLVGGQCRPLMESLCERTRVEVALADSASRGANSSVTATLSPLQGASLPVGVVASITAAPLESAVQIAIERKLAVLQSWAGSADLPSTGLWSVQVSIGQEHCVTHSRTLQVGCRDSDGFISDGQGRCVCPAGFENKGGKCSEQQQQQDPCKLATVRDSLARVVADGRIDAATFRPGTALSVSLLGAADSAQYQTLLVPLQGTETRPITEALALGRSG